MEQRTHGNIWKKVLNGFLIIISVLLVLSILFPYLWFDIHKERSPLMSCISNVRQVNLALIMYSNDHGGKYLQLNTLDQRAPDGKAWTDMLGIYIKSDKVFRCPVTKERLTYSYNRKISGVPMKDVNNPEEIVSFFESVNDSEMNNNLNGDTTWKLSDGGLPKPGQYVVFPKEWKKPLRGWPEWARHNHKEVYVTGYADGHVRSLPCNSTPDQKRRKSDGTANPK